MVIVLFKKNVIHYSAKMDRSNKYEKVTVAGERESEHAVSWFNEINFRPNERQQPENLYTQSDF